MSYFQSFDDFINMGGHGFYVWLCYGLVVGSLLWHWLSVRGGVKHSKNELAKFYRRQTELKNQSEQQNHDDHNSAELNTATNSTKSI